MRVFKQDMEILNKKINLIIANIFAILIFFILFFFLLKDYIFYLNEVILFNSGDPVLNLYFLKWGTDYLLGNIQGSSIFNLPLAYSLAFSDNLFGNQFIFLPYYLLTDKPLLSFNLWIITTYFLNYLFMYLYIKKSKFINTNTIGAIIGAVVFTFSLPSFDLLGGHLQLLPLYFIPITLYLLEKSMITLEKKYFLLLWLSISFQFYLGIQTGFILLILLLLLLPVYCIYLVKDRVEFFKNSIFSIVFFLLPTIMLLFPYLQTSQLTGHRTYNEVLAYIPSIINFFSQGIGEKAIFIGWPVFILLLFTIAFVESRKSKFLLFLIILSYLFFLKETHIFQFFFTFIPGFDSIRTPGRFIFVSIVLTSIYISHVLSIFESKKLKIVFFTFLLFSGYYLYNKQVPQMKYIYKSNEFSNDLLEKIDHKPTLILPLYEFKNPDVFSIIRRMKNINMQFPILDIYNGFNPTFVSEIENQYLTECNNKLRCFNFFKRISKLGFNKILIERKKITNPAVERFLNDNAIVIFKNEKFILYLLQSKQKIFISLNNSLLKNKWELRMEHYGIKDNKTYFYGYLKGKTYQELYKKKESIDTTVLIKDKHYTCSLQLDKIKNSASSFICISNSVYKELLPMNHALKNPKVKIDLLKGYNTESNSVTLKITNTGSEEWLAGFAGKYGLALSYKLENKEQNLSTGYDNRFHLPYNIDAGESIIMQIPIEHLKT